MLGEAELTKLIFDIQDKIIKEVTFANRCGEVELNEVLNKYGFNKTNEVSVPYIDLNSAKILIIGNLLIQQKDVSKLAKSMNIDPYRIDYVSYTDSTNFNYDSLKYSNKYSDVIFGSVPHSSRGMDGDSSIIVHLESHPEEYPRIIRATDSNSLVLNKTSLKKAFMKTRIFNELLNWYVILE